MRVLIIEDERKAAQELRQLILGIKPSWIIADIIPSVEEAIEWFRENKMPDLIFSDIQLADAVCFDIFDQVKVNCPIFFCTAYDEYAIKAFETNSIDYLLKPIDKKKLVKALEKLDTMKVLFTGPGPSYADLSKLIGQISAPVVKTILVHHKEKIIPLKYTDIAFFYYNQGVITIRLISGSSYHTTMTIDEIENAADPAQFYRANRQYLVNRSSIQNIEKFFARKLVLRLNVDTPEIIIISKAKASDFLTWLEGN